MYPARVAFFLQGNGQLHLHRLAENLRDAQTQFYAFVTALDYLKIASEKNGEIGAISPHSASRHSYKVW